MNEKKMMLGNEAIARGAWEAGVKVSSAYPGTPSTEISEYLAKYEQVYAEWAPNEKVAVEVAAGASIAGVRAMASMKHVGLNMASDPVYTLAYTGVNGGLVLVVADDPGIASSQNEQDTRRIARSAHLPVLEPADSQEAKDFTALAFALSEQYDTPVILRTTTKLSHSQSVVSLGERVEVQDKIYERNAKKFVMMPANAIERHKYVEERENLLAKDGCVLGCNRIEGEDSALGFITAGVAYQYVKEVFPNAKILKLGLVNPLPKALISEFCQSVERVVVVEELEPVIEEQVLSWGLKVEGKSLFTVQGEYSANALKQVILGEKTEISPKNQVPARPPILCSGCPHRAVFSVLNKLKIRASGDIGCYTLGAVAPLNVIDTCVCMGASVSMLHGIEKAKGKDFLKGWVAVIGDSTFLHTGVNSLMNCVYNQSSGTVIILDNRTTGMTGHQEHAATGKTLKGEDTYAVDFVALCKALGVRDVVEINAFAVAEMEQKLRECQQTNELTVIVARAPCALLKGQKFPFYCQVEEEKCKHCNACVKIGCPAIAKENGEIKINVSMCNGCGLCQSYCKFNAIKKVERI